MRVSHRSRFTFFIDNMNMAMSDLMELNIQASSQKKVNRPSDDPVGMSRILNHRDTLESMGQYRENIETATGWLNIADEILLQVDTVITRLKEIAEQAATGTMGQDNREQVSYEARQLFGQLINIANTEYEGKHIFGGHKTDESSFVETLWMTTNDSNVAAAPFSITGNTEDTVLVRFLTDGDVDTDDLDYEYSLDGGKTFTQSTLAAGTNTLDLDGVLLTLTNGTTVSAHDPNISGSTDNGTWMWIRPTAQYMGDDQDSVLVDTLGPSTLNTAASGVFRENVIVRIDGDTALASNISYSYSVDGGVNWSSGHTSFSPATASSATLVVPGGYLTLTSNSGSLLAQGNQFVIRPQTGRIMFEISPGEEIQVNSIGKDVFGGIYQHPGSNAAGIVFGAGSQHNLFETAGNLVGYLETNNQEGIQQALENLRESNEHILNNAARIGARENRLQVADSVLQTLEYSETNQLSRIEDVDMTELMTQLASQQIIYETVLKSSSMIMRMSLANYI